VRHPYRDRARELRRNSTDAERRLWRYLRNRQCLGWKFRRQFPIGPYIADFACPDAMLVIEADGGQHGIEIDRDLRRTAYLERKGWTVLRFWNPDILTNIEGVLDVIHDALRALSLDRRL
jgi:very-short-patch-repair endonuclease